MSRELTSHKVNGCNEALTVEVMDEPGSGGACHRYDITGFDTATNPAAGAGGWGRASFSRTILMFQNGPIPEVGVNGITNEILLAVLEHRLAGFQAGPFACDENGLALAHIQEAQAALKSRTTRRLAAGIEGTHQPDPAVNIEERHPAVRAVLQFFAYSHLPENLQAVSRPFHDLAQRIADGPQNAEATVALRKLLEAKDAAVRAVLFKA